MKAQWKSVGLMAALALAAAACADSATAPRAAMSGDASLILASGTRVNYKGQGWTNGALTDERCTDLANDGGTGQGITPGEPYLLWVLTANGATAATLYLPTGPVDMFPVGGTFKYKSQYWDLNQLGGVYALYAGTAKGNVQLVVSHGCRPKDPRNGAWCSPGFWKNNPEAFAVLEGLPAGDPYALLFGNTVAPFAVAPLPSGFAALSPMTLGGILGAPSAKPSATYNFGTGNTNLTPFNAVGAYFTSLIPGYVFDPAQVGLENHNCPIDANGVLTPPSN